MALKRFRPALEDCQHAATLQQASPSPKTLLRLARCQLALGSTIAAAPIVKDILSIEPTNTQALQLREKIKTLEGHVKNFETAKEKKEWGLARLALDKCLQAIEGEGGEIPAEWRIWRVELELARGNWEGANMAAKCVFPQRNSNTSFYVPVSAMPFGRIRTHQISSPCEVSYFSSVENWNRLRPTRRMLFDWILHASPHRSCENVSKMWNG